MQDIMVPSPDSVHKALMNYVGEIRFGPAYYSLTLDQISFGERVFGDAYLWSPDSKFCAVQEWETTSEGRGPQTRLLLVDLKGRKECILSRAEKGFIVPKLFEDGKLIYTKEYYGPRRSSEFEIEFLLLKSWDKLN